MDICRFGCGCLRCLCSCMWNECQPQRQIIYDLENNFQLLKDERLSLRVKKDAVKEKISKAENEGQVPDGPLNAWVARVDVMEVLFERLLGPESNPNQLPDQCPGGCCYFKFLVAYKLGKEVKETIPRAKNLRDEIHIDTENFVPAPMVELVLEKTVGLDTEVNELFSHLSQPGPQIIRVCGMGGVGKTVLMKKTHNEFKTRAHTFDVIIWVDASASSDILSIQEAVSSKLGRVWTGDIRQHARAITLNSTLKEKSFLVFIDDPGKKVTLKDVGIPVGEDQKNHKVVFSTTETSASLGLRGNQYQNLEANPLPWNDAWTLFQQLVGEEALSASDPETARSVANLCGGLPLTLVTVGLAMSNKKNPDDWAHTEELLKKYDSKIEFMKEVYERYLVSYNGLNTAAQRCFLYCSLFPKDQSPTKEELLDYWLGENLLAEDPDLKIMRRQGEEIISTLISARLLEKGNNNNIIGMHNIIRRSALWIATSHEDKEGVILADSGLDLQELSAKNLNWETVEKISLINCRINKLNKITGECSNLSTLILRNGIFTEICGGFFQAMICLKVLDLSWCDIIIFPSEISLLTELQYLNMSHTHVQVLPSDFKKLTKLTFLDLSFVPELQQIPGGVITKLTNLRVLNMYSSGYEERRKKGGGFSNFGRSLRSLWGDAGQTLFEELKSLDNLQDLRISVHGSDSLKSLQGSEKLNCIHSLFITDCQESPLRIRQMENLKVFRVYGCPQPSYLKITCVKNLTHVEIESCWALNNLTCLSYATKLQSLKVVNCVKMVAIIDGSSSNYGAGNPFSSRLRSMYFDNLPALKQICENNVSFPCLENINVHSCPNMSDLPFAEAVTETLKVISGHERWWRDLQLDEAVKKALCPYFRPSEK